VPLRPGAAVQRRLELLLLFGAAAAGASGSASRPYPPPASDSDSDVEVAGWACRKCTFVNKADSRHCEMCQTECGQLASVRAAGVLTESACSACTVFNMPVQPSRHVPPAQCSTCQCKNIGRIGSLLAAWSRCNLSLCGCALC
jgi:hypothetical protein